MRSIDEQTMPVSLFSQRCIATVLFGSSFRAGVFGETNLGDQGFSLECLTCFSEDVQFDLQKMPILIS